VCEEREVLRCVSRVAAAAATTVNKVFFRGLTMFLIFFKLIFFLFLYCFNMLILKINFKR